ncbi:large-conductance mechanosensitive channel [Verrucomicrobiota bacterium]|jgi:large conductance mechanosensitive channel|nr:large-conductance mechanosensitive channel [Verrucomicrobiota bacterium]
MKNIFDEFKTFILRGNVVQLAVAVVIGAAFGKVTSAANDHLIQPILGIFSDKGIPSLAWMDAKHLHIGSFLDVCIGFVITALAVFLIIVKPMNKLMSLTENPKDPNAPVPPPPATLDDVVAALKDLKK